MVFLIFIILFWLDFWFFGDKLLFIKRFEDILVFVYFFKGFFIKLVFKKYLNIVVEVVFIIILIVVVFCEFILLINKLYIDWNINIVIIIIRYLLINLILY